MPDNGGLRLISGNKYTIQLEARGDATRHYAGKKFERVPRVVTVGGAVATPKDNIPTSFMVDSLWRTCCLSFIADSSGSPTPVFGVSEQTGAINIRNIKLH